MVRKRILVKGDVQDAAYRIFVKKVALALDVKGVVRNLSDGTVEVHCEADGKVLKRFLKALETCSYDGMRSDARVREMDVQDLKEKARPFKIFDIDYGQKVKGLAREEVHRQELMVFHGSQLRSEMRDGFDKLGHKVDGVGQKVDSMHEDMNKRFLEMNERYHVISENLIKTNNNIERMNENNAKMNAALAKTVNALVKLVEKDISERKKAAKRKK